MSCFAKGTFYLNFDDFVDEKRITGFINELNNLFYQPHNENKSHYFKINPDFSVDYNSSNLISDDFEVEDDYVRYEFDFECDSKYGFDEYRNYLSTEDYNIYKEEMTEIYNKYKDLFSDGNVSYTFTFDELVNEKELYSNYFLETQVDFINNKSIELMFDDGEVNEVCEDEAKNFLMF